MTTTLAEAIEIYEMKHLKCDPNQLIEILRTTTSKAEKIGVCNLLAIAEFNFWLQSENVASARYCKQILGTFLKYGDDQVKAAASDAWYAIDEIDIELQAEVRDSRSIWGRRF